VPFLWQNHAKILPSLVPKTLYCNDNPAKTMPKRGEGGLPISNCQFSMSNFQFLVSHVIVGALLLATWVQAAPLPPVFAKSNLVAWCIVPFDAKKRGPEERAQMLDRLGIRRLAYDYRAEHIPTFDAEVEAMQRHGIEFMAWWFPGELNDEARGILAVIERHKITPQLWITGGGSPAKDAAEQRARVETEARRVRPIAEAASRLGCKVGLYNHGNWFGEPENEIQIIERLKRDGITNVGVVYNFHHGHDHIERFPDLFRQMQPYLLCVNLNGMVKDGERQGRKILHLGEGDQELGMLRVIRDSGWFGPVGIIDHRPETDSEETLRNNLRGYESLLKELQQPGSGPAVEKKAEREKLPLYKTVPAAAANSRRPWATSMPPSLSPRANFSVSLRESVTSPNEPQHAKPRRGDIFVAN
jgi:sugar phosphate isomerase/epimerase